MSNSVRPHRRQPTRLPCPWDSPGKNTGVGCHFLLQGTFLTQGSNLGLLHCKQTLYGKLEVGGASRHSTGFGALEEGLISSSGRNLRVPLTSDSDRKVPADLGQESQASSWVEAWNSACLSRCSRGDRPLVERYLEPGGLFPTMHGRVTAPSC